MLLQPTDSATVSRHGARGVIVAPCPPRDLSRRQPNRNPIGRCACVWCVSVRPLQSDQAHQMEARIESMGYEVGYRLVERTCQRRWMGGDQLEAIKFVCKDLWSEVRMGGWGGFSAQLCFLRFCCPFLVFSNYFFSRLVGSFCGRVQWDTFLFATYVAPLSPKYRFRFPSYSPRPRDAPAALAWPGTPSCFPPHPPRDECDCTKVRVCRRRMGRECEVCKTTDGTAKKILGCSSTTSNTVFKSRTRNVPT